MGERTVKEAERPCPLCRHTGVEVLHTPARSSSRRHPLEAGYDVVCCGALRVRLCRHGRHRRPPMTAYYAELSKYEDTKTGTGGGDQAVG